MADNLQEYVITTDPPTIDFVDIDPYQDPDYAELKRLEKLGQLPKPKSTMSYPVAAMYATPDMLVEQYYDEESGEMKSRFKKTVIVAEGDSRGRIRIPKDKPEVAKRLLKMFRNLGRRAELDPIGLMLPEELPDDERPPVNKGGRPKRST